MIYFVTATDAGKNAVASYDGQNSEINFLEAAILACIDSGISMRDLTTAIREEYPYTIEPGAISDKIRALETRKLVEVIHEVTAETRIVVSVMGGIKAKCLLGEFLSMNLLEKSFVEIKDGMQWFGSYSCIIEGGVALRIEYA